MIPEEVGKKALLIATIIIATFAIVMFHPYIFELLGFKKPVKQTIVFEIVDENGNVIDNVEVEVKESIVPQIQAKYKFEQKDVSPSHYLRCYPKITVKVTYPSVSPGAEEKVDYWYLLVKTSFKIEGKHEEDTVWKTLFTRDSEYFFKYTYDSGKAGQTVVILSSYPLWNIPTEKIRKGGDLYYMKSFSEIVSEINQGQTKVGIHYIKITWKVQVWMYIRFYDGREQMIDFYPKINNQAGWSEFSVWTKIELVPIAEGQISTVLGDIVAESVTTP